MEVNWPNVKHVTYDDTHQCGEFNLKPENYKNIACNISNERVRRCPSFTLGFSFISMLGYKIK